MRICRIGLADRALLGLATHKLSRIVAHDHRAPHGGTTNARAGNVGCATRRILAVTVPQACVRSTATSSGTERGPGES